MHFKTEFLQHFINALAKLILMSDKRGSHIIATTPIAVKPIVYGNYEPESVANGVIS